MEGFEEEVEEIWAGRATLGQAIARMPDFTIDLSIAESASEVSIEMFEGADNVRWYADFEEKPEQCQPGEGVEALLDVEARQPKARRCFARR